MATRLPAAEKVARDRQIVADRARGHGWTAIAERHGLTDRQCRSIVGEHRAEPWLADADPVDALREALEQLEAVVEDCARLAESTANDAVRLGAIKARLGAMAERFVLMRACGLLPRDLGLWRHELDARRLAQVLADVLERHDVPEEVWDDLVLALRGGSRGGNGHVLALEPASGS